MIFTSEIATTKMVSSHTEPLGSNQDHTITGSTNLFDYLIIMDGHGIGKCIEQAKLLDWETIVSNTSAKAILNAINCELLLHCKSLAGDGTTISIVKIYQDKLHVLWLGDSQVHILVDDTYYKTVNHNTENETECKRETNIIELNKTFKVVSENTCKQKSSKYFVLSNGDILAMSRALGHDFVTLQRFDEMVIPLNTNSTIKILAATDGLYDMLYEEEPMRVYSNYTAKDYTSLAKKRWMQQWNLYDDNLKVLTPVTFQSDMDDVGVIVYEMNM